MRPIALSASLALLLSACPLPIAVAQDGPDDILEAYRRADHYLSGAMSGLVRGATVEPHWLPGGQGMWYRVEGEDGRRFLLVDARAGTIEPAFDHDRLAQALAQATGETFDAGELPFTTIELSEDAEVVGFPLDMEYWECDLLTYECRRAERNAPPGSPAEESPAPAPPPAGTSPDGKWRAEVRGHDVWVEPTEGGEAVQLSDEGSADHSFGHLRWSPSSRYLVAWRTEPGDHLEMPMIESLPEDSLRPVVHTNVYDLPGDKLDVHELWVLDVEAAEGDRVAIDPIDWWGPENPHWLPGRDAFRYRQIHRGFRRVRVIEVDCASRSSRVVIEEQPGSFVPPQKEFLHYIDDTDEIIWASERDGWNHLYLIDGATGEVIRQLTRGEWVVRGVESVDEEARTILLRGSGRHPGEDPYLVRYYRVSLDGGEPMELTPGEGQHEISFSPTGEYFVDTWSRVDLAPVTELRRSADSSLIAELARADTSALEDAGWPWPEPFVAKGRDGETDIWGVLFRPSNLDPSRRYPVIESIYAGPHDSFVPKTFSATHGHQNLAELGFIVVQIDGMGTSNRSKAFHDVADRNLADSGFPDRIAWMRALADEYPYVDITRVGIYGSSAGGYNAARALLAHGDFYDVGIALSANHDHRTDKVWWNELWMGYPIGPHYAEQSNVTNAGNLEGKLLLIHGEMDTNVYCSASTMQLADALIKSNKDFDMLIVPGAGHGFGGTYVTRRMWDYFVRHLHGVEPPKEYEFAARGSGIHFTIKNLRQESAAIYWASGSGLTKYHDLEPGQELDQHSFIGHRWVARVDGRTVSRYTVDPAALEWSIY
ncbi:MAG: prolyl oligopeptidase family serine peptidase [Armatimonadia bacterium]|nr:prolyl oligopeptidase family serine peptidase [Armatimonadia bacterium]